MKEGEACEGDDTWPPEGHTKAAYKTLTGEDYGGVEEGRGER